VLRAVLFDFNGILVDDEPIHLELYQRVLAEEGIELDRRSYNERYLGLDDRGCFDAVLEAVGEESTAARVSRLVARKAAYYQERMHSDGFPFFVGAFELVDEVAAAGLMLGVVSGALREEIELALRQANRRERFKVIVAADDVLASKPDPEGYRQGLELLSTQPPLPDRLFHPHEVLAIEDSPTGLESARAAGLVTLGVAQTYPETALGVADAVVERLAGIGLERLTRLFASASSV